MHLYITTSTAKESHDTHTLCNCEEKNFLKDLVIVSQCTPIIYTNGLQSTLYPISSMTCA